jgi:vancomycin resistance protein YoaR
LLAIAPGVLWLRIQLDDGALHGARLADQPLPPRSRLLPELRARADAFAHGVFTIRAGPYQARTTRKDLGASLDVEAGYERTRALGRSGNPIADLATYWAAAQSRLNLAWPPRVDRARLTETFGKLRQRVERPPASGSVSESGRAIAGIPGQTLNSVDAIAQLERALRAHASTATLAVTTLRPPAPVRYAAGSTRGADDVLQTVETLYTDATRDSGRIVNIEIASAAIDGTLLGPGDEFSFNQRVGERSYERGFRAAKELANGRVVDGIGGGICQVAATLHAAAFLAGLEITIYQPHSRPVSYIDTGLDTMVSWPDKDLRFGNPYPFPVVIRASAQAGVMRIQLFGSGRPHPVEWASKILQRIEPGESRVVDPALPRGQARIVQQPIPGLLVERRRTVYWPTGPRTSVLMLRYAPVPRIVATGGGASVLGF